MIQLCGLWLNTSKEGKSYFSGNIGNARIVIFKNTFKEEGSKEPDYKLYIDEGKKKPKEPVSEDLPDIPF